MKRRKISAKRLHHVITAALISVACDHTGQPVNGKALNRVMKDIIDQNKFFSRLCNLRSDTELVLLFNGCNIGDIYEMANNPEQLKALRQTVVLNRELYNLKKKIKNKTKGGKKTKSYREEYKALDKIYRKSIKTFRALLGINNPKSDKAKHRYSDVVKFYKKYNGKESSYYEDEDDDLNFFYDDYDDEEDDEEYQVRHYKRKNQNRRYKGLESFRHDVYEEEEDDEDDFDDTDDEEDNDEELDEIRSALNSQGEQINKVLHCMGAVLNSVQGTTQNHQFNQHINAAYQQAGNVGNSQMELINQRMGILEKGLSTLINQMQNMQEEYDDEDDDITYESTVMYSQQAGADIDSAELDQAMEGLFNGGTQQIIDQRNFNNSSGGIVVSNPTN